MADNPLWHETLHDHFGQYFSVDNVLYHEKTDHQDLIIFDNRAFGRVMALDGVVQTTERDEFIYHEMIVHVPMAVNPSIRDVLVIGAGDGGVARELSRYSGVQSIDVAEIDRRVVEVCREFLPGTAHGFDDPRVTLHFTDGLKFVRHTQKRYDLIIVDSTDPSGPGEVLFTREFYGGCLNALTPQGILVNQHESPFYREDAKAMRSAHQRIHSVFPVSEVYQAHIPTYPSGHWLFGFASPELHPLRNLRAEEWNRLGIRTRYYNTRLHKGAFCLPTYVEEDLKPIE